ncbi:CarD family transcriptional regulator [Ruminococcus sp.]|uniref:CarD family transcriptional regulator n=1 Tax=Ruminococcus sp. TaxID=41978 RepID=UPI0025CB9A75|nr:CarD family transcriptional regulator [Ruminococcus sp.]MBQ8966446.1 CarD family transcriptional regulator [Ruminococcus sp.]
MFDAGELVVYGNSGVYRVLEVGSIGIKGCEGKQYYTMEPVFGSGTSYVPVDTGVFMRKVMTADEANALIDSIPEIGEEDFSERNPRLVREHYSASMKSHDTAELISMIKEIWHRGERAKSLNRKLSRAEQQFLEQAENLVYGEFSVVLGIPREEVLGYIRTRIEARAN